MFYRGATNMRMRGVIIHLPKPWTYFWATPAVTLMGENFGAANTLAMVATIKPRIHSKAI
jgi:hypothetical protein